MKIVKIPKKSGGYRTIYCVYGKESVKYRCLVGNIAKAARNLDKANVMHGFVRERSPVTCAQNHIGHAWSVCFDLQDFFDHVDESKLKGLLSQKIIDTVIVDGSARQGLPTSPSVANVAASKLDKAIIKFIESRKINVVYTRYADDLTFSGDDESAMKFILSNIPQIVTRCGWFLRKDKTHIQLAKHGRRHICGIAVGEGDIFPTRKMKRRLRAAIHQENVAQTRGLAEWCKLKPPKQKTDYKYEDELQALGKVWRINVPKITTIPDRGPDHIDGDFCITSDPVYILGCSTWTTGWTSCLAHPNGTHRKGSFWWCTAPGTRMAMLLSKKEKEIASVTRRVMRARAFVHTLRDGGIVYDRIYGDEQSKAELSQKLKEMGIVPVKSYAKGVKVVGHVLSGTKPYLDSLKHKKVSVTLNGRKRKAIVLTT